MKKENANKKTLPEINVLFRESIAFLKIHFNGLLPLILISTLILFVFGMVFGLFSTFVGLAAAIMHEKILFFLFIIFTLLGILLFIAIFLFQILAHATIFKGIIKADKTKKLEASEWKKIWKKIYSQAKPIILLNIAITAIIFGGYLLLLIPGLIFAVWYLFSVIILLAENKKGREALRASKRLVRGYFWPVVWRILILGAAISAISLAVSMIPFVGGLASMALSIFIVPFTSTYYYFIYKHLLKIKAVKTAKSLVH